MLVCLTGVATPTLSTAAPVTGGKPCHTRGPHGNASASSQLAALPWSAAGSRQSYGSRGKARSEVVKVAQRWPTWVRRLAFAAVLILAAATPGMAATRPSSQCQHSGCEKAGTVRWIQIGRAHV